MHGIAERGEDSLDEGERPAGPLQHSLGAVAILDVGGVNLDRERSAVRVSHGEAASATGSREPPNALVAVDLFAVRGAYAAPPGPRSPLTIAFKAPF
ncbi:MAG: hypothetical protein ACJAVR_002597 [Paracoccaceae bacterium]|jgi:hypothetical protein